MSPVAKRGSAASRGQSAGTKGDEKAIASRLGFDGAAWWKCDWSMVDANAALERTALINVAVVRPSSTTDALTVSYFDGAQVVHTRVGCSDGKFSVIDENDAAFICKSIDAVAKYLGVALYDGSVPFEVDAEDAARSPSGAVYQSAKAKKRPKKARVAPYNE